MSLIYQKMAWHLSLIIRMSNSGDAETTYGCRFVGISKEDQFKIEVYQIVDESKNN